MLDCSQIVLLISVIKSTEGCDESDGVDSLERGVPGVCSAFSPVPFFFFFKCTRRTLSPLFQIINKEAKPAKASTKYLHTNLEAPP